MKTAKEDEAVGYKKPPRRSQFRPGQSGNPSGRPKQRQTFQNELLAELAQTISVRANGNVIKISKRRALLKALIDIAIEGEVRAAMALISLCSKFDQAADATRPQAIAADDQTIVDDFVERELRRRAAGFKGKPEISNPTDEGD